jgi:hypothetical protein
MLRNESKSKCDRDTLKKNYSINIKTVRKYTYEPYNTDMNEFKMRQEIINKVLLDRKRAASFILVNIKNFKNRKNEKNEFLIKHILKARIAAAIFIQKMFRMFIVRKSIRNMLNNNNYVFTYKFDKINDYNIMRPIDLKLKLTKGEQIYPFHYCRFLDSYYMSISKSKILPKKIRVNFLVNDKPIIDPRYDVDCIKGVFYNIIDSSIFKNTKAKKKNNTFEKMFEINYSNHSENSISDVSISETGDIDRTFRKIIPHMVKRPNLSRLVLDKKQPVKSILKKCSSKTMKRVQFSLENIYCN